MANGNRKLEQIEPPSNVREAASHMANAYAAFREQGFNEQQALYLCGQMLRGIAPDTPGE